MPPPAIPVDRAAVSSAVWARSVAVNLLALFLCRSLLGGVEIHGVKAYAFAAIGIELPTLLWWLALRFWHMQAFSEPLVIRARASARVWAAGVIALTLVVPLALATSVPGLLMAEWIGSLDINGFWTYVAASTITAGVTIAFRQSRPLRFVSTYVTGFASDEERMKRDESRRAFREAWLEFRDAIPAAVIVWWYTHRRRIGWAEAGLRVAALIAGTVAVGFWLGVVLALVVWVLPALILWPLIRREEQRSGVNREPFRVEGKLRLWFGFVGLIAALLIAYGDRL